MPVVVESHCSGCSVMFVDFVQGFAGLVVLGGGSVPAEHLGHSEPC